MTGRNNTKIESINLNENYIVTDMISLMKKYIS